MPIAPAAIIQHLHATMAFTRMATSANLILVPKTFTKTAVHALHVLMAANPPRAAQASRIAIYLAAATTPARS
jgi:hypothetical protein